MKKFFEIIALLCAVVMCSSCNSCSKDKSADKKTVAELKFDSLLIADYDYAASQCKKAEFYESQVVLDSNLTADVIKPVSIVNVVQAEDTCYQFIHEIQNGVVKDTVIKVNDWWLEDCVFNVRDVKISLNDAINKVKAWDGIIPESNLVVLRRPLGPNPPSNALYIFGCIRTGFVKVNSASGEINLLSVKKK